MSGAVIVSGKMRICMVFLVRPGSWSFSTCDESIVLPSGSLSVISFDIITGGIVCVVLFSRWIFAPESMIVGVYFLGELGGFLILLIKIILVLIILILFIISPNRHLHPFSLTPSPFL